MSSRRPCTSSPFVRQFSTGTARFLQTSARRPGSRRCASPTSPGSRAYDGCCRIICNITQVHSAALSTVPLHPRTVRPPHLRVHSQLRIVSPIGRLPFVRELRRAASGGVRDSFCSLSRLNSFCRRHSRCCGRSSWFTWTTTWLTTTASQRSSSGVPSMPLEIRSTPLWFRTACCGMLRQCGLTWVWREDGSNGNAFVDVPGCLVSKFRMALAIPVDGSVATTRPCLSQNNSKTKTQTNGSFFASTLCHPVHEMSSERWKPAFGASILCSDRSPEPNDSRVPTTG